MIKLTKVWISLLVVCFCCGSATAQDLSSLATGLPQIFTFIKKMCGEPPSFSADATVEMTESGSTNVFAVMPSKFIFSENNARWDLDAGQMSGSIMPPEAAAALRDGKLDKMTFIAQLDNKVGYVIFPRLQAYMNFPIPESEIAQALQKAETIKLKIEILGKEMLDGYNCTKNRITIPAEADLHQEAIVWSASELKNCPVKLEINMPDGKMIFHFQNIKFDHPLISAFEVATNFVCKASSQEIMDFAKRQQGRREELNTLPQSDIGVTARILHYGITTSGNGVKVNAPDDPTGKHLIVTPGTTTLETETNRIPAKLGVAFGCYCEVSGLPQKPEDKVGIETVWTYPPMVKPDGSISKGFTTSDLSRINTEGGVRGWVGYRFEKDFELVSGEWKFEVRYEGKTLAAQCFTVYRE